MSESGFNRPRRAFARNTDSEKPIADDDTPVSAASAARRGTDLEASDLPGDDTGSDQQGTPESSNPFARPGSEAAAGEAPRSEPLVPAPAPVMPPRDGEDTDTTGSGWQTDGIAEGAAPEPRRSAVSSATPPESQADGGATATAAPQTWVQHHRKALLLFVVAVLVVALLVALGAFLAGRGSRSPSDPVAPSPSPSTTVSAVPAVSVDDLISAKDANAIVPDASWAVVDTFVTREDAADRPACIGEGLSDVNPVDTFQRTIGTSQDDRLAVLHQVDLYATEVAAQRVQEERVQSLVKCDAVQAHIKSSSTVTGLGDEVTQLTVSFQDEQEAVHTVLLVRTGRALSMLDVTRNDSAVPVDAAVAGLVRSLGDICDRVDGMCPSSPAVVEAVPPAAEPEGWLIAADLPRIRPGYGRWTPTDPTDITSPGMGCENIPLATEPGPTARQQRKYLMTQDDATPTTFGIDEMVFDFEDNVGARVFTDKLITNLLSCKDRVKTAEVTDLGAMNGTGKDGTAVSARLIVIEQAVSDDAAVRYQLAVAIADTRVSYLLTSVTNDYQFTGDQIKYLALRMAERNSQG